RGAHGMSPSARSSASIVGAALAAAAATAALAAPASAQQRGGTRPQLSGTVQTAAGPVAGATVRLYAAGARGAQRLARGTTGSDGTFALPYAHQRNGTPLYVVAERGSVRGHALDRSVRLLSIAGRVGALLPTVHVEERSTVAGGYAFARFLDGERIS